MAHTYRNQLEHLEDIADQAARNTMARAGTINPTPEQQRAAQRCAMRHLLQHLAATNPTRLRALRDELRARAVPAGAVT